MARIEVAFAVAPEKRFIACVTRVMFFYSSGSASKSERRRSVLMEVNGTLQVSSPN